MNETDQSDTAVVDNDKERHDNFLEPKGVVVAGAFGLSACGGGGSNTTTAQTTTAGSSASTSTSGGAPTEDPAIEDQRAARAALHASLCVTASDIITIRSQGLSAWLNAQTGKQSETDSVDFFSSRGFDDVNEIRYFQRRSIFDPMIWSSLITTQAPVRSRMALALSEIFVVSLNQLPVMWPSQAVGHYWDVLNEHAFGNFRDLLEAITLSPAMGAFLDTLGNSRADQITGRNPDENFARELMQLFTIGLFERNPDGTPVLSSGRRIPTYTNDDVEGLAKVFTGYQLNFSGQPYHPPPGGVGRQVPPIDVVRRPMTHETTLWSPSSQITAHSLEEKSFLGLTIPSGTGPEESVRRALDHLFQNRNLPPFFASLLIQRLVTSNPSPSYVARVSGVFADNGNGIRGDLAAVFKAVIMDEEATGPNGLEDPSFGRLREPMIRFAQWARTFNALSPSGSWEIRDLSPPNLLNQAPFRAQSVFNFFSPDYSPRGAEVAAAGLLAPEFQIADEVSAAGYVNFIRQATEGTGFWTEDILASFESEIEIADDAVELLDHLDLYLTAGQLGRPTKNLIIESIESINANGEMNAETRLNRVRLAVLMTMTASEYLIQK